MLFVFVTGVYASSGEGFFGAGEAEDDIITPDSFFGSDPDPDPIYFPTPEPDPTPTPAPYVDYTPEPTPKQTTVTPSLSTRRNTTSSYFSQGTKLENRSDDPSKVIKSYNRDNDTTRVMTDKHKSAGKAAGNEEKFDRYRIILSEYPFDYLAAYKAGEASYNMGRYSTAKTYLDKSLEINPNYSPAKSLLTKTKGALERNN